MDIRCFGIWKSYLLNQNKGELYGIFKKIGTWADELTKIGISIVALGVVLEVLFKGAEIPFW